MTRLRDEAIQPGTTHQLRCPTKPRYRTGLLRCARNDEGKKETNKGSRTPTDADPTVRTLRCGARPLSLLLPQRAGGRDGRARLSAFHHGACCGDRTLQLSSRYALPGTRSGRTIQRFEQPGSKDPALLSGRYPLFLSQSSELLGDRSSCRSGVGPEPPGSGGDPPPAGTALAPPAGLPGRPR